MPLESEKFTLQVAIQPTKKPGLAQPSLLRNDVVLLVSQHKEWLQDELSRNAQTN